MSAPRVSAIMRRNLPAVRKPLLISWALTHRCNQRCIYCRIRSLRCGEMDTDGALALIDRLAAAGTMLICFSGGEPLMREDACDIFAHAHAKGVAFDISSNGSLVAEKITGLKFARLVCISLDGPAKLHDEIRGEGAFAGALDAVRACKKRHIPVYLRTVLSALNLQHVPYLLGLAAKMDVRFLFQPVTPLYYGSGGRNPHVPEVALYRKTIDMLQEKKKAGNRYIQDSVPVLEYLRNWPSAPMECVSGKVFFHILPDGRIGPCIWGKRPGSVKGADCLRVGLARALRKGVDSSCSGCWDAAACQFNLNFFKALDGIA